MSKTEGVRSDVAILGAIVVVATILRVIGLGSGLWYDEIVTLVESARLPLAGIVTEFDGVNTHPLYSVLAHSSISAFGESAWALRLPACIFGVASVWMVFVLGEELVGRVESMAGAAILATSYHHIWFSQNARGYTMLGFFALLSTLFLLRAHESGRARDYVFYSLTCAAGVYTHLTMAFVVAGQMVVMLAANWLAPGRTVRRPLVPLVWAGAGAVALSVIVYLPFVPALVAHLGVDAPREAAKVATGSWALAETVRLVLSGAGVVAALAGGAIAMVGAISLTRLTPLAVALLVTPAIVTALVILVLGQPLRPRFFFFLSGAAAIFVGRGIGSVVGAIAARREAATRAGGLGVAFGALLLVAASAFALPRNYQVPKQDFEGAVRFLDVQERQGARVAAAGPACLPFAAYYRKAWSCLSVKDEFSALKSGPHPALVVYTLPDYIADAPLREALIEQCPIVLRLAGSLGGGDMVVCEAGREGGRE